MREAFGMDASLISIILIVLITSALVVFTLAQEDIESPVEVLKNIYPEKMYSQASVTTREKMDFSFTVAARREMKSLEIQYVTLIETDPPATSLQPGSPLEQIAENISTIATLSRESQNPYLEREVRPLDVHFQNTNYQGLFYDFPVVRYYSTSDTTDQVVTSFLILDNGTNILYFEGISDFYIHRLGRYASTSIPAEERNRSSIDGLRIRRNENVTYFSSAPDVPSDWLPITSVPEKGRVVFRDVEKHDTFSIDFTIEIPRRPAGVSGHVIRVYADGELSAMRLNLVE